MLETVVPDKILRLGALAAAGSAQKEEDVRFGEQPVTAVLVLLQARITGD